MFSVSFFISLSVDTVGLFCFYLSAKYAVYDGQRRESDKDGDNDGLDGGFVEVHIGVFDSCIGGMCIGSDAGSFGGCNEWIKGG